MIPIWLFAKIAGGKQPLESIGKWWIIGWMKFMKRVYLKTGAPEKIAGYRKTTYLPALTGDAIWTEDIKRGPGHDPFPQGIKNPL